MSHSQNSMIETFMAEFARKTGEFPHIVSVSDISGGFQLELGITEDLDGFHGHFPGNPVLPGVVQVHWAATFARQLFCLAGTPNEIKQLKFKNIVQPPATLTLKLMYQPDSRVQFEFSSDELGHSSGQLIFGQGPS